MNRHDATGAACVAPVSSAPVSDAPVSDAPVSSGWSRRCFVAALAAALPWAAGCGHSTDSRDEQAPTGAFHHAASSPSSDAARSLLMRAMKSYSETASYADAGELRYRITELGLTRDSEPSPFSITFVRPNKLRFHSLEAIAVCDGSQFWATVEPRSGQVLTFPPPPALSVAQLYAEPTFALAAAGTLDLRPPQLEWLLSPVAPELPPGATVAQLDDDQLPKDDRRCHRIEVTIDDDPRIYWLDAETNLLKRYEFPSKRIAKLVAANDPTMQLKVWADFPGAQFHPRLTNEAFAFEPPGSARLVNRFVDPPPAAPSPLLGKTAAPYSFVDLQGNSVSDTSLAGKVVILDMWTTWCGYCLRSLPNLQRVYQRYRDDSRVAILAVSNDAADVSDDKVAAALRDIGVTIPLVRDRSELAKSVFQVSVLPTMIVLSPAGVVEHVEIGYRADLPETLPKQIDALLSGQPLFPAVLEEYARAKRRHDDQLAEATVGLTRDIELPEVDIAPASEPASFNRTQLWASQEVKSPGNVLVVEESGGERRLLAIEASRDVVEIRLADGAVAQRHALDLPAGAAISFLRTAVDGAGRRYYAAFASAQQQVFVFDADWKLGAAYPPEGKHPGLSDATLADLDGDGQLELHVGYWGPVGVQTANLAGKRLRSNRSLENIMRLIPIGPGADGQSRLLCAAGGQAMIWLNHDLEPAGVIPTPSRGVYTMLPRSAGNEPADFAALSSLEVGVTKALGVGADGHERWTYDLPRGVARYPADPIALVRLGAAGDPAWLFPAADGSLHFLASDGQLLDRFNYGRLATGATGAEIGGQPALIVATPEDIAAWRISPK